MQGEVVYLYAFDVANEIDTTRVAKILADKPVPFEIRIDRTVPKDVPLYKPLAIEPPPLESCFAGRAVRLLVRVYDIGVVSILMRVAFEAENLANCSPITSRRWRTGGRSTRWPAICVRRRATVCKT